MLQEKNFCKIHWKITKREINWKFFADSLTTRIKFRLEKDWKNFDFFADVNSWNCEWCYIMFDSFKLGTEKFFIINKNNFDVASVWDTEYSQIIPWDEENFLDFSKIENCETWAENVTYEIWDIDEKLFENKNLEQEILQEKTIISEKNIFEKIDFFYVIIFFIFLISVIFTIYSIKKK